MVKRGLLAFYLSGFLAVAADAAAPDKFDLKCSGTETDSSEGEKVEKPYAVTYRIDLSGMKWCEGDCSKIQPVAEIQPTRIFLDNQQIDTSTKYLVYVVALDRLTGEHTIISAQQPRTRFGLSYSVMSKGSCSKSPFSGFPSFETKF